MHKSQLVNALSEGCNIPHPTADKIVTTFFNTIQTGLINGERTEIRGLGSFRIKEYRGYTGRNPKTGSAIYVPPKRMPFFRVGRELKAMVATGRPRVTKRKGAKGLAKRQGPKAGYKVGSGLKAPATRTPATRSAATRTAAAKPKPKTPAEPRTTKIS
jgi:integration host factor subunit beta